VTIDKQLAARADEIQLQSKLLHRNSGITTRYLLAEAVFYETFTRCDPDVMASIWADEYVVCVHPGSRAIVDFDAIIRSWANIFSNADRTEIKYTVLNRVVSNELAVHVVAEEMPGPVNTVVLATNVYRKLDGSWFMLEHHASLVQNRSKGQTLQ
jgi:SnoaL-like domain